MSLCYDFEKWTMITLASIAISLTVGLVLIQYAHGIFKFPEIDEIYKFPEPYFESKLILTYCFEHADRPNPVQDLIDQRIVNRDWFEGKDCATVKYFHDTFAAKYASWIRPFCGSGLTEYYGKEPPESEVDNCVENRLESEGIK